METDYLIVHLGLVDIRIKEYLVAMSQKNEMELVSSVIQQDERKVQMDIVVCIFKRKSVQMSQNSDDSTMSSLPVIDPAVMPTIGDGVDRLQEEKNCV